MPAASIAGILVAGFLMVQGAYVVKTGTIGAPFVASKRPPLSAMSRIAVGLFYIAVSIGVLVLSVAVARNSYQRIAYNDAVWAALFFVPGVTFVVRPELLVRMAKTAHPELTPTAPGILILGRIIGAVFILFAIMIVH